MATEEFQNSVVASDLCAPVPGWVLWDLNPYGTLHTMQKDHKLCVVPDRK